MALLQTKNLTHVFYDKTTAISNINFTINEGDFIVLSGANGSGKTVLIRHLNGLLMPTKGEVLLNGENIKRNIVEARKNIGLIFQDSDSQIVGQTVEEDIAFGLENLRYDKITIKQEVSKLISLMHLEKCVNKDPHTLSGGQKKRLAIAGILAIKPRIIIFDEPFTGLDYPSIKTVAREIVSLKRRGHTIIVVTHELEKILAYANRLIIMKDGEIALDGSPAEIIDKCENYDVRMPLQKYEKVDELTWVGDYPNPNSDNSNSNSDYING